MLHNCRQRTSGRLLGIFRFPSCSLNRCTPTRPYFSMQTGDREMPLFTVRRALFAIQRHLLEIAAAPESAFCVASWVSAKLLCTTKCLRQPLNTCVALVSCVRTSPYQASIAQHSLITGESQVCAFHSPFLVSIRDMSIFHLPSSPFVQVTLSAISPCCGRAARGPVFLARLAWRQ